MREPLEVVLASGAHVRVTVDFDPVALAVLGALAWFCDPSLPVTSLGTE